MKIIIFSDSKTILKSFQTPNKKNADVFEVIPSAGFTKAVRELSANSVIYLDTSSFDEKTLLKNIAAVVKKEQTPVGIIDSKGTVTDPASLFFSGVSDYIGKDILKQTVSPKRFSEVVKYFGSCDDPHEDISLANTVPFSGADWKTVHSGKEYKFCFLFLELDKATGIKTSKFGEQKVNPSELFKKYVETQLKGSGGKIWMWMENGGLILFPFDGRTCPATASLLRLILNRIMFVVEESIYNEMLSFRTAMHIGSTVYRERGDTGKIVSDSINFIFHLGQKRAEPGSVYITEDIKEILPKHIETLFTSDGSYEGRNILRMKKLSDNGSN